MSDAMEDLKTSLEARSAELRKKQRVVKDLADLKAICKQQAGQQADFFVALTGGFKSSKTITYDPKWGWTIHNDIDDTWQEYKTDRNMLKFTHIGKALAAGALYWYGF